ncbi:MAG TPA: fused MFS/spermidine synthase [Polyangiaceae bacterium]|jgi:spermidine synthase|nr:fused MFS/spermidine synthase [Polyangiaceae bacterium]
MTRSARKLLPLLFGSGMCALVYQIAWFREFRMIFGASTSATAAVLAIFTGGLGAGGIVLGVRVDRHPRPIRLYGQLELLIAAFAATTPGLLRIARWIYIALGGTTELGLVRGTGLRLALTAFVLAAPTFLMGGTLPAAARGVEADDDLGRRSTGLLYGVNTLGAVVGCSASTFYMLEAFGTRTTLWIACAVNFAVGLVAMWMGTKVPAEAEARPESDTGPDSLADRPTDAGRRPPAWFTLIAAGLSGFAFFLMELVWYRMLGPILGGTVFTFGLILAVALLGIGLGGALYSAFGRQRRATLTAFASTCLLEALFLAIPYALGDRVAVLTLLLRPLGVFGFSGMLLGWTAVTVLVVLPAAVVAGVQFPLLIALLGGGREHVGRQIGLAYAVNTFGAIVGSLCGGFGLIPALTAPGCWRAVVWTLMGLGATAILLSLSTRERERRALPVAAGCLGALLMARAVGPTAVWRHSPIGVGRVEAESTSSASALRGWMNSERRGVRWEADGVESSVALSNSEGWAFIVNGKIDGSARGDAATQVMGGLLGGILHPGPKSALVIGLGTGSTAGWLGAVPEIDRVDVVELEPVIRAVAGACRSVNHDVLQNPKVRITIGDAREVLLTTRQTYDIIFSEPSNPYRAGIASLFTREYYEAIESRLSPDGLFLQWLQAYNVDGQAVRTIYATLASTFPTIDTWELAANDLLLVASRKPIAYDADKLRARITQEPYRSALALAWRAVDLEAVLGHFVASAPFARHVADAEQGRLNVDDQTLVEFGFARMSADIAALSGKDIRKLARQRSEHRPRGLQGVVDWNRSEEEWASFLIAEEESEEPPDFLGQEPKARLHAQAQFLAGEPAKAVSFWFSQRGEPRTPTELAALAESLASAGDERARSYIDKLRAYQPTEAEAIEARLLLRQGKPREATVAIEATFDRHRRDAWPWVVIGKHAIDTAEEITRADPSLADRVYAALAQPLPVYLYEDRRIGAMLRIAMHAKLEVPCARTLELFEPYVPWQQDVLDWRAECYVGAGDEKSRHALADVAELKSQVPVAFEAGLTPTSAH